jgi:hypothetical protein
MKSLSSFCGKGIGDYPFCLSEVKLAPTESLHGATSLFNYSAETIHKWPQTHYSKGFYLLIITILSGYLRNEKLLF